MQTSVVCPADTNLADDMSHMQRRSHHGLVKLLSVGTHEFCLLSFTGHFATWANLLYCVKAQSGPGARLAADAG